MRPLRMRRGSSGRITREVMDGTAESHTEISPPQSAPAAIAEAACSHAVQLYDAAAVLLDEASHFLGAALGVGRPLSWCGRRRIEMASRIGCRRQGLT